MVSLAGHKSLCVREGTEVVTGNTQLVGQCCMSDNFPQTQPAFAYKLQSVKYPIINAGTKEVKTDEGIDLRKVNTKAYYIKNKRKVRVEKNWE